MSDHLNSRQALAAEITESLRRELHARTSLEKLESPVSPHPACDSGRLTLTR